MRMYTVNPFRADVSIYWTAALGGVSYEFGPIRQSGKILATGQESPKSPKNGPKMFFLGGFYKHFIRYCVLFLLEYKITNGLLTFYKNHTSGKNQILELCSKNL